MVASAVVRSPVSFDLDVGIALGKNLSSSRRPEKEERDPDDLSTGSKVIELVSKHNGILYWKHESRLQLVQPFGNPISYPPVSCTSVRHMSSMSFN